LANHQNIKKATGKIAATSPEAPKALVTTISTIKIKNEKITA
jgi:hypothetical protein